MQNYEIQPGHSLILGGRLHATGDVLPAWYADRDGGLAARLAVGCLGPTSKPATAGLPAPAPKVADDPAPALFAEAERLRAENAAYAASNRELAAAGTALAEQVGRLTVRLGEATATNADLLAACEDHQAARDRLDARVLELTAELEAATAPAAG